MPGGESTVSLAMMCSVLVYIYHDVQFCLMHTPTYVYCGKIYILTFLLEMVMCILSLSWLTSNFHHHVLSPLFSADYTMIHVMTTVVVVIVTMMIATSITMGMATIGDVWR
mmetsp:Transcript_27049/g.40889  ORF Transcript_27049/g.40889 Transcript_27049/m.40889 type:complete len:111 (+) Transcript_27049:51-383(+)